MTDQHVKIDALPCAVSYIANGTQAAFPFPFPIFAAEDLAIRLDGARRTAGYTVSGVGLSDGGTVTLDTPPAEGTVVALRRELPLRRVTDFQTGGPFRARAINSELDYLTALVQQVAETADRAVVRDPHDHLDPPPDLVLPAPVPNALLGWNGTGDGLALFPPSVVYGDVSGSTAQGAGPLPRPLKIRLGEVINVRDFGAVGDNAQDDSAAFQAAIDQAVTRGGGMVVVPGTAAGYRVDALRLGSGVWLQGLGGATLRQPATATAPLIRGAGAEEASGLHAGSRVADLTLVGTAAAGSAADLLAFTDHSDVHLRNLRLEDAGGLGLRGGGAVNARLRLEGVRVSGCGAGGLLCEGGDAWVIDGASHFGGNNGPDLILACRAPRLDGLVVEAGPAGGVILAGCAGGHVSGASFRFIGGTPVRPLCQVGDATRGASVGVRVEGCAFAAEGTSGPAVLLSMDQAESCAVAGGTFSANSAQPVTALHVASGARDTVIDTPDLAGNGGGGAWTAWTDAGVSTDLRLGPRRPRQPAFCAKADGTQTDLPPGSYQVILFPVPLGPASSALSGSVFTAPREGFYQLSANIWLSGWDRDASDYELRISTPTYTFRRIFTTSHLRGDISVWPVDLCVVAWLAAGDTATVRMRQSGGVAQADIHADSTFSGCLLA